ncbi:pentapeptide repeat-containing protein [Algoriphagus halophilus]|uniref:Uncharacterized protein YjbI, contains pentapeptide repeats n=1 Tax=Algoriphagus halophilus TaxID=226505 RepID=A0A1N6D3C1_9BACT|nr:pentapeptide repeat-containing protein [Algoriphagus halophilus]SIN65330.1 Uncharacterized protein YjbI, contains pentapeptide repeats [Algoriphagus halophilus]
MKSENEITPIELLEVLKKGAQVWGEWLKKNALTENFDDYFNSNFLDSDIEYISEKDMMERRVKINGLCKLDLSGFDLQEFDLRFFNLKGANLEGANLSNANLEGVTLEKANLKEANLKGAILKKANLKEANLERVNPTSVSELDEPLFSENPRSNPGKAADFSAANLEGANLSHANLEGVNLYEAILTEAILTEVTLIEAVLDLGDFTKANLLNANLCKASMGYANFTEANLHKAYLPYSSLFNVNLKGANLQEVDLQEANLSGANLSGANLEKANLEKTNLEKANLEGANLTQVALTQAILLSANFSGATIRNSILAYTIMIDTNLSSADLTNSILTGSNFTYTKIENAIFDGCNVYGISVWDLIGEPASQNNLVITNQQEPNVNPIITVDDIEVAQFIYLMLNNTKIRKILTTITGKGVLILGRFSPERKKILDAIRNKLRELDYVPMMFDFEQVESRDYTETIQILAGMSRFVIADITSPKSSPLELQATVPNFKIPLIPIIQEDEQAFAMFSDLKGKYKWVLEELKYTSEVDLIKAFQKGIIDRAIEKEKELFKEKEKPKFDKDVKDNRPSTSDYF